MRFLYFGDKHERRTSPENRLDNFLETQRRKTEEIKTLGKKYGVTAFIQPGDFFDSPNPGNDFVSEIASLWGGGNANEVFSKFRSGQIDEADVLKAMKDYIPIIGVVGNHELYGNNIRTLKKTAIGQLNKLGLIHFATKDNPYYFHTEDGLTIAITGSHYHMDIDTPEHLDDYVVEEKLGDYHIHIVHGMLSDKNMGKYIRHTLIDQIKHTKADLTISGHDHLGFPLTEINGKYFVNTGAITRLSNDIREINRKPKVLLIDITKENGMKLKEIYLKSALDGELVLDRTKLEEKKAREVRLAEYKKAVRDAGLRQSTDILSIVRDLADTKDVSKELKEDVLNRVSEKKAEMSENVEPVLESTHVKKIVLENFQSHAYTELDFENGFNILVGESGQGKTSVLRAFNWVYENKPTGKGLIRRGEKYAKVSVHLSNGYVISRYIERKQNGKNGYEIIDPNGNVEFHNTKILPEIQKILGFNKLVIDKDLQFNLNFMKQGTGWFLIGDNYSAPQRAKILGSIYGVQYADAVIREFDNEERKLNEEIKKANEEKIKIEKEIESFAFLKEIEQNIREIESILNTIKMLEEKKERISKLYEKYLNYQKAIKQNDEILASLKDVKDAKSTFALIQQQEIQRNQLETLVVQYKSLIEKKQMVNEVLEKTEELEEVKNCFGFVSHLISKKDQVDSLVIKHREIDGKIKAENLILKKTESLPEINKYFQLLKEQQVQRDELKEKRDKAIQLLNKKKKTEFSLHALLETLDKTKEIHLAIKEFDKLEKLIVKKEKLNELNKQYVHYETRLKQENEIVEKNIKETQRLIKQYKNLLQEEGTCPTCFGTIDQSIVERIVSQYQIRESVLQ